jgi:hypothetical protein
LTVNLPDHLAHFLSHIQQKCRVAAMAISPLAPQYLHGVYIPSALLLVGTYIVKSEWLPHALVVAILLGGWKIYQSCTFQSGPWCASANSN